MEAAVSVRSQWAEQVALLLGVLAARWVRSIWGPPGTQFTCFTSTKVLPLLGAVARSAGNEAGAQLLGVTIGQ